MNTYYIRLETGQTLPIIDALTSNINISVKEAKKLLVLGSVWNRENNSRIRDEDFILKDQLLVVFSPEREVVPYPFDPKHIVFEDEYMLIVDKQPGFPTVPTPYSDLSSLSYGLNKWMKKGEAYVINRLDLATRGLVIYGKSKKAESALHALFKNRQIRKWYMVQTEKKFSPQRRYHIQDELEFKGKTKEAETIITFCREDEAFFTFGARPLTGRTHQIRKHFARYLYPIWGDPVYGPYQGYPDLGLTCVAYIFFHPFTGKKMCIKHFP